VQAVDLDRPLVGGAVLLHAGYRLAILFAAFAADGVHDAGLRHQVALVAGVDEDRGGEALLLAGADRVDAAADPRPPLQPAAGQAADPPARAAPGLLQHLVEDQLGDVRLEAEAVGAVLHPLRVGAVLLDVIGADAVEELARVAADGLAVAVVGG